MRETQRPAKWRALYPRPAVIPAKAGIQLARSIPDRDRSKKGREQVVPAGIRGLDQPSLPGPIPLLYLLFALDGGLHRGMGLVPNEAVQTVSAGESPALVVSMLPGPFLEVRRHAYIDRAVDSTGNNVDGGFFHWTRVNASVLDRKHPSVRKSPELDSRLCRHPREGGDPAPGDCLKAVGDQTGAKRKLDSRLRGNDGL